MASSFPVPMQNSLSDEYLQSGLNSAMVAIQSLVNLNNSRYETFARETHAAIANMAISDRGENRNTNSMATVEMTGRPSDRERGVAVERIPQTDPRRRSSVTFTNQPPGSNVKVYDPNSSVKLNMNNRGLTEPPRRSALKLSIDSNAPLYDKPGNSIQLGSNNTTNPVEQHSANRSWPNSESVGSNMQYFDNPTIVPQPVTEQQRFSQIKWQEASQPQPYDSRLPGVDTKPAGFENASGEVSYTSQILVEIKVVFVRVSDIDTIGQQFEAEVYIQARWPESQFAGYTEEQLGEIEFRHCWNPMLVLLNLAGHAESDRASMLLRYEPDRVYPVLTYMWHIEGIFRESMELQHFPFDVQEISIVISSERSIREIELVCDYAQLSNVSPRALQGNQEWSPYRHVDFIRDYNTLETVSMTKHPILVAAAHIKRKLGFYIWNVIIIVVLILALSFTTLAISPVSDGRLGVTMTLFLTSIAFKLVVKTTLPSVSYLTYLDMYVVFVLVYLTLQATENAIMIHLKKFKSPSKIEVYDEIAQGCLIGLLIIFHLAFIIYIQVTAFSRQRSMSDKELDFEIAKINVNQKAAENKTNTGIGGAQLSGIDAINGKVRPDENPLFNQPPAPAILRTSMGNQQGPMEVTNPLFNQPPAATILQPPVGDQQGPIEVTNPLFNPTQATNPAPPPLVGNQQPFRPQ